MHVRRGVIRRCPGVGPVFASTQVGPIIISTRPVRGVGPVAASNQLGPIIIGSRPVRGVGPVITSTQLGPISISTRPGPIIVGVYCRVGCNADLQVIGYERVGTFARRKGSSRPHDSTTG